MAPATALLAAILLVGGLLRFTGLGWGEGVLIHPDEYTVARVTSKLTPVYSLDEYFDTFTSPLNPRNVDEDFVYGTLPVFLVRYVGEEIGKTGMFDLYLLGRRLSALADWLVVLLVFLIGLRLFDARVGLLGAFLYAVAGFPIQQAHFYTVDTFAALFSTGAFYFAVRAIRSRRPWLDASMFGVLLGMGMASKVTAAAMASMLILALLMHWGRRNSLPDPLLASDRKAWRYRAAFSPAIALVLGGIFAIAAFRSFQPYSFLPPRAELPPESESTPPMMTMLNRVLAPIGPIDPRWTKSMQELSHMNTGSWDAPPNHQWATRTRLLFPLHNSIAAGLGWPLGIVAWLSVLWAVWEIVRRHPGSDRLLLPTAWVLLLFLWQGTRWVMAMRYFLPLYPQLVLLVAWAPVMMWDRVQALLAQRGAPRRHPAAWIGVGIGLIAAAGGLLWGLAVAGIYHRPITRVAASHWVVENVPSDITFVVATPAGIRRYELGLDNDWVPPGQPYDEIAYTALSGSQARPFFFEFPFSGSLESIRLNHIATLQPGTRRLHVTLTDMADPPAVLAQGTIEADFYAGGEPRGRTYDVSFAPVDIGSSDGYVLTLQPDAGDWVILSGSTVAHEGDWDWPVPFNIPPYDMWRKQFQGYQLQLIVLEDTLEKRDRLQYILDRADYLTISSNRFYHTVNRIPQRWPLTIAYYKALFSGELGFEPAAEFTSRPALGPLEFCDDYLEEAWSVYDHPRVFIFHKTPAYHPQKTARLLGSVDLHTVQSLVADEVRDRPVALTPPGSCSFLNWRMPIEQADPGDATPGSVPR